MSRKPYNPIHPCLGPGTCPVLETTSVIKPSFCVQKLGRSWSFLLYVYGFRNIEQLMIDATCFAGEFLRRSHKGDCVTGWSGLLSDVHQLFAPSGQLPPAPAQTFWLLCSAPGETRVRPFNAWKHYKRWKWGSIGEMCVRLFMYRTLEYVRPASLNEICSVTVRNQKQFKKWM